jgi:hypothetical protein
MLPEVAEQDAYNAKGELHSLKNGMDMARRFGSRQRMLMKDCVASEGWPSFSVFTIKRWDDGLNTYDIGAQRREKCRPRSTNCH